jgi:hypothetical protein
VAQTESIVSISKSNLRYIKQGDIQDVWETIKPGLDKIASATDEWIAEDIYMALKLNTCSLFLCEINGNYKGFVVSQKQENYGKVKLHIWAAFSQANDYNVLENSMDEIKSWANNIEAKKITFSTTRKGWEKVAPKLGFEKTLTTYEIAL